MLEPTGFHSPVLYSQSEKRVENATVPLLLRFSHTYISPKPREFSLKSVYFWRPACHFVLLPILSRLQIHSLLAYLERKKLVLKLLLYHGRCVLVCVYVRAPSYITIPTTRIRSAPVLPLVLILSSLPSPLRPHFSLLILSLNLTTYLFGTSSIFS